MRLPLLCLAMALSGAAALTHQMLWVRMLGQLFGQAVLAVHVVLFVFFMGTGLGAWWVGRVADRRGAGMGLFCALEVVLALSALAFGPALAFVETLYLSWSPLDASPGRALLMRGALSVALLIVPTVAMGGTLPVMARATRAAGSRLAARIGWLYGLNTIGAAAGALLTVFAWIPTLGLSNALTVAAAMNLAAAVIAWVARPAVDEVLEPRAEPTQRVTRPVLLVAAGLAGFVSIGAEVVWTRMLSARFGGTVFAYATILAAFLLALGVGPTLVGWLDRARLVGRRAMAIVFTATGLATLASVGVLARIMTGAVGDDFVRALAVMGLPALAFGLNLPLLLAVMHRDPEQVGRDVGTLWLANTVGAVLAPLLVGLVAVPLLGTSSTLQVLGWAAVVFGAWAFVRPAFPTPAAPLVAVGAAVAVTLASPGPDPGWHLAPGERLLVAGDGVSTSLAVVETAQGERILKLDGHYKLGSTRTRFAQSRQGLIPLLLHDDPTSCLMLGVGSGGSVGGVAAWGDLTLDALEIVPEVPALLPWFEEANAGLLARVTADERLSIRVADARHVVRSTTRRYDVVVGDLFMPWNAGEAGMYTREHLEAVSAVLTDDGVFVQWLPLYQLPLDEMRAVVATFLEVFPSLDAVWLYFNVQQPAVGLVASKAPVDWSVETLSRRGAGRETLLRPADLVDATMLAASRFADREALARFADGAPVETRDRPRIEYGAAPFARIALEARPIGDTLDALAAIDAPHGDTPDVSARREALATVLAGLRDADASRRWRRFVTAFTASPDWDYVRLLVESEVAALIEAGRDAERDEALAALRDTPATAFLADVIAGRAAWVVEGDRDEALRLLRLARDARPGDPAILGMIAELEAAGDG